VWSQSSATDINLRNQHWSEEQLEKGGGIQKSVCTGEIFVDAAAGNQQ
jgi:hypothetical protein